MKFGISKSWQSGLAVILGWVASAASVHYNTPTDITVVTEILTAVLTIFHIHIPNTDATSSSTSSTTKGTSQNG